MLLVLMDVEVEIDINCLGLSDWCLGARCKLGCLEAMCLRALPVVSLYMATKLSRNLCGHFFRHNKQQ
jgi:hypothetical protein